MLRGLMVMPKSFFAARQLIRDFDPEIVVGAGVTFSGPVLLTASLMRLPNAGGWTQTPCQVGPIGCSRDLSIKLRSRLRQALPYFRGKGILTGNPVRREFFEISKKATGRDALFVIGVRRSQGARAINEAMIGTLQYFGAQEESGVRGASNGRG